MAAASSSWRKLRGLVQYMVEQLDKEMGSSGLTREEATTPDRIARSDGALLLPAAAGRCRPPHIRYSLTPFSSLC